MRWIQRTLLIVLVCGLGAERAVGAVSRPHPTYPTEALKKGDHGTVLLSVTFGANGRVAECHVIQSTASKVLDDYSVSFVRNNWVDTRNAGRTGLVPIDYNLQSPSHLTSWDLDFPFPEVWARDGIEHPYGDMTISVKFDFAGRVEECAVEQSTGHPMIDTLVLYWVRNRWHHELFAGRSVRMTIGMNWDAPATAYRVWRSG